MEFLPTYKLEPSFFRDVEIGTKYFGKLKGFRSGKDYWIGVCELTDIKKQSETGKILHATVDFIYCKKSENTLSGLLNLKQQIKENKLRLTFKGFTGIGFPIFFHDFV